MKLGLGVGYSERDMDIPMDLILEAERLGYDSCWTAEAWVSDAVSPLAWIGAQTTRIKLGVGIMQAPARTPAMCAMTAMTLDALSGGRFILGVGPSGPQVIEGWHGVPYQPSLYPDQGIRPDSARHSQTRRADVVRGSLLSAAVHRGRVEWSGYRSEKHPPRTRRYEDLYGGHDPGRDRSRGRGG